MAAICCPLARAWRAAARVSAVSPDWEMKRASPPFGNITSRCRNSEAISTSAGMRATLSNQYLATSAACHEVPAAISVTLGMSPKAKGMSGRVTERSLGLKKVRRVSPMTVGCS